VLTWANLRKTPQLRRFWWRRLAKIYPITLALMVFAYLALPQYERIPGKKGKILELTLMQAWWPKQRVYFGGNGVSWSLSCEIFFYLVFPLVLKKVKRLRARGLWTLTAVTLAGLIMVPVLATDIGVSGPIRYWLCFVFPPYQFGFFLVGMLMAHSFDAGLRLPKPSLIFAAALLWLGLLVGMGAVYSIDQGHGLPRPLVLLISLPAFVGLLGSSVTKDLRHEESILTSHKLTYMGIISFELYLVHKPLFLLTDPLGIWKNSGGFEGMLVFVGFLSAALVIAVILHHGFQVPIERVLQRSHHPLRRSLRLARRLKSTAHSRLVTVLPELLALTDKSRRE
jgi:peptidoglycan/LPS O-acetylase OafA/YrhL